MSNTEREIPRPERAAADPPGAGEGDGLEAARASAERLLQTADDAIARALSGDSERFLQATRQSGGQ
jgi:hypothetical protein